MDRPRVERGFAGANRAGLSSGSDDGEPSTRRVATITSMDPDTAAEPHDSGSRFPAPDDFARDYILLALRLERLIPGLIDAYFGPADLRAQVDAEPLPTAYRLRETASSLHARLVRGEVQEPDRRRWLEAQMVALEAQSLDLTGDPLSYTDFVACCFDLAPERRNEASFDSAADELSRILPPGSDGTESIADRLASWDERFVIATDRLPAVVPWLLQILRSRTDGLFGLPPDEQIEFDFVTGKPWSAYNWYQGQYRSRVEVNTDLPMRAADLVHLLAHEAYAGHHTEHAWKERRLVMDQGRLEASISLINTPECLISEGLANLSERFVAPDDQYPELLTELYGRAGLPIAADPAAAREAADLQVRIRRVSSSLRAVAGNAAFMLHADGVPRDEVAAYLRRYLLTSPERAEKRLSFIEHPQWRLYVFVYFEGERLLRRWFELGATSDHANRFGRIMREQLTPGSIAAEAGAAGFGPGSW